MNAALDPDQRADLVIAQLTLDEKIQLVHGIGWGPLRAGDPVPPDNNGGAGEILGVPRLGIPSVQQADSAVGVRMAAPQSRYATLLPSVLGAASSWDLDAETLGQEHSGDDKCANSNPETYGYPKSHGFFVTKKYAGQGGRIVFVKTKPSRYVRR
jgi:beta-glucosidase